ncbi:hypothetical protein A2U01_0068300 [Trifolium medium]|uniref:Uncharacterized protein n=1 Tax=Trifolium medium TaxID=97028 RepID=A0A392SEH9_9FABA|nr:hypothetical protein [Trifolium medium]
MSFSRPELQILEMLAGRGISSLGEEARWFSLEPGTFGLASLGDG